jgi:hypothetical protein
MSIEEQQELKQKSYAEAMRYMDNAEETLRKAKKEDGKLLKNLDNVYDILHLSGYYDGVTDARVISAGFDNAHTIISKIRPINH